MSRRVGQGMLRRAAVVDDVATRPRAGARAVEATSTPGGVASTRLDLQRRIDFSQPQPRRIRIKDGPLHARSRVPLRGVGLRAGRPACGGPRVDVRRDGPGRDRPVARCCFPAADGARLPRGAPPRPRHRGGGSRERCARARRRRRPAGERLGPRGPNSTAETYQVTTAAFLAVLLGTFFPTFFLVTLYIQSEAYNARLRVRPSRARARTRAVRFSSRASRRRRPTPTRTSKRPTSPATLLCCGSPVLWVS